MNTLGRTGPSGGLRTHLGMLPCGMEPTVLGYERRYFGGLEQRLPRVLVLHAIEPLERPVFGQDELPQIECPPLAWQNSANEHDLDHDDKLDVLVLHALDAVDESGQLCRFAPGQALLFPGGEPHRGSRASAQLASRGSVM